MSPTETTQALITSKELAARLKVTVETLCRWRARGVGPQYHRFDRAIRYSPQDVDTWLTEQAA